MKLYFIFLIVINIIFSIFPNQSNIADNFNNSYADDINSNSILFPKELLNVNPVLTYKSVKSLFMIFETVFRKSHLNNYNKLMPKNYLNFKFLILKELKKINE